MPLDLQCVYFGTHGRLCQIHKEGLCRISPTVVLDAHFAVGIEILDFEIEIISYVCARYSSLGDEVLRRRYVSPFNFFSLLEFLLFSNQEAL